MTEPIPDDVPILTTIGSIKSLYLEYLNSPFYENTEFWDFVATHADETRIKQLGIHKSVPGIYDAVGNVINTIDALGNKTTYVYDALSRETATIDPLSNRATTVYDAADKVIAKIDARGNTISYTFDADGRQTVVTDANGAASTTVYDAAGHTIIRVRYHEQLPPMIRLRSRGPLAADTAYPHWGLCPNRWTTSHSTASPCSCAIDTPPDRNRPRFPTSPMRRACRRRPRESSASLRGAMNRIRDPRRTSCRPSFRPRIGCRLVCGSRGPRMVRSKIRHHAPEMRVGEDSHHERHEDERRNGGSDSRQRRGRQPAVHSARQGNV